MKQLKLVIFDLDSTLAPIGRRIPLSTVEKLRALQALGVRLAICSGKPTAYLCGILRQLELHDVILMGELGLTTQIGYEMPPKAYFSLGAEPKAVEALGTLARALRATFPGVWMQGNDIVVTPFFSPQAPQDRLRTFIYSYVTPEMGLDVYEYQDCFDVCPKGIDKGTAVRALLDYLHMNRENVAAVGDGANDIPMFEAAGLSVLVGDQQDIQADFYEKDIDTALDALLFLAKQS